MLTFKNASALVVAPTDVPRIITTIYIRALDAVSESCFTTPDSLKRLPSISIPTNGAVVGKDFFKDPGIHRTLLGDGLATIAAGFLGGPANTTYGENTGVLAVTGVYDPAILRIAACYAIILGFIGKFGILLQTIPLPVMGGVSVILFGMIASVGVRTVVDAQLDFGNSRNLIISSIIFVLGIAVDNISIWQTVSVSGLALAAFSGVVLNKILPKDREIKLKKLD